MLQICGQTDTSCDFSTSCSAYYLTCQSFINSHKFISTWCNNNSCVLINCHFNLIHRCWFFAKGFWLFFPDFVTVWNLPKLQNLIMTRYQITWERSDVHWEGFKLSLFFFLNYTVLISRHWLQFLIIIVHDNSKIYIPHNNLPICSTCYQLKSFLIFDRSFFQKSKCGYSRRVVF